MVPGLEANKGSARNVTAQGCSVMGSPEPVSTPSVSDCLTAGGEMGALMRSLDWSKTPIGGRESWSPALRMVVKFLLANRFPLLLCWGPQFCQLYNDPYRPILGT